MIDRWEHHPAFQDILVSLRQAWYWRLGWLGIVMMTVVFLATITGPTFRMVFVLLTGWVILRVVSEWRKGPCRSSRLFRLLVDCPESIVWIYGLQIVQAPLGVHIRTRHRITFVTVEGTIVNIDLPSHRYLVVMKWLNRVLPHVEFGWSQERSDRWGGH